MSLRKVLLGGIASAMIFSVCAVPAYAQTMRTGDNSKGSVDKKIETPCERERNRLRPYVALRSGMSMQKNHIDKNVWANSGAIGMQYEDFRGEVEYTYRDKMRGMYVGDVHKVGTQSLMFNAYYDVPTGMALRPFINAGIGMSKITTEIPFMKDSTNKFSWSVGAGAAYEITNRFAFDVGYRFIDIGDDVKTNEFYGGIRYAF